MPRVLDHDTPATQQDQQFALLFSFLRQNHEHMQVLACRLQQESLVCECLQAGGVLSERLGLCILRIEASCNL